MASLGEKFDGYEEDDKREVWAALDVYTEEGKFVVVTITEGDFHTGNYFPLR